jgi:hypothetical protein
MSNEWCESREENKTMLAKDMDDDGANGLA